MACSTPQPREYASLDLYPVYNENDLGVTYQVNATSFKLWSPTAEKVILRVYPTGNDSQYTDEIELEYGENGVWATQLSGDLKNQYYTFQIRHNGKWLEEKPDIYAKAVGVNGKRGMIVDLAETDPEGWEQDKRPNLKSINDIILYELHVRDLSMNENSGIQQKGKFLGLTETGTKSPEGEVTGIDHIKDLGVTHVHLLPSFDYRSIDESKLEENKFNWGYDPQNYNVPEGSYATDPFDGTVRIREFKQMVKALHDNGLRVVMDVVYNHTGDTETSNFNQLVPNYFYRFNEQGQFSDASACGNETASDREMMRSFMVQSVKYWAEEYHIDGFRFDLMGIHDIETMNAISATLREIDPTIFVYGEGWMASSTPLPEEQQAIKRNTHKLERIAAFSDDMRDGIKGSWHDHTAKGFASGADSLAESVKFGIAASIQHSQVDYQKVNYSNKPWAAEPYQTINYVSCHDNHTLYDKLKISNPQSPEGRLIDMHKLSNLIVLTSQGIPFLHAGAEMLRTKQGVENSYQSPDSINRIDWSRKASYKSVYDYYKSMVLLRKNHPAFRMPSTEMIQKHLEFIPLEDQHLVAYTLNDNANGDQWKTILVVFNGAKKKKSFELPEGSWTLVVDKNAIEERGFKKDLNGKIDIPGSSGMILVDL